TRGDHERGQPVSSGGLQGDIRVREQADVTGIRLCGSLDGQWHAVTVLRRNTTFQQRLQKLGVAKLDCPRESSGRQSGKCGGLTLVDEHADGRAIAMKCGAACEFLNPRGIKIHVKRCGYI